MDRKINWWKIIGILFLVILLIDMVIFHIKGPTQLEHESSIPEPEPGREPFYYDFQNDKWLYRDQLEGRANDSSRPSRQYNSSDNPEIQEYLEEHIDGYKEDTYWGETYEFNDKDY